ncbi:hypothetical protein ANN_14804, partial [Periplaneta americana]
MAGLCEGGNEPPGFLKAIKQTARFDAGSRYMVSRETLRRYATRRSETNTNGTEFDSSELEGGGGEGRKQEKCIAIIASHNVL